MEEIFSHENQVVLPSLIVTGWSFEHWNKVAVDGYFIITL